MYYGARYYSVYVGAFITTDPIESDPNLYRYCGDNPVIYVDPTGEQGCCCCCVDDVEIKYVKKIDNGVSMGHSFAVVVGVSYHGNAGSTGGCALEWWERTDMPYVKGQKWREWTEMSTLMSSSTLDDWKKLKKPCPGSETAVLVDTPWLDIRPGRTDTRILQFTIVVKSGADCMCAHAFKAVTATQILVMVNGKPDWSKSSFTVGPSTTGGPSGDAKPK